MGSVIGMRRRLVVGGSLAGLLLAGGAVAALAMAGGTSARARGVAASVRSRRQQERVLDAAYRRIVHDRPTLTIPGARDVEAYAVGKLWAEGIDGAGTTVAVMAPWDDPSIAAQIAAFDKLYGLPNPQVSTLAPPGGRTRLVHCPPQGACFGWATELELDVKSVHLMAPYAKILIVAAPADYTFHDDASAQGNPEVMQALETISRHHLANVVSISGTTGEASFKYGRSDVIALSPGELTAAAAGIPFLAITGDCGPTQCGETHRDVAVFADSPWTLAVGGSVPFSPTRSRLIGLGGGTFISSRAPGAGLSSVFARPAYQSDVASITHSARRSVPDITMDDSNGTSEAGPLMAGVLALATQANGGRDLGPINPVLYDVLGPRGAMDGITDVIGGDDTVTSANGKVRIPGFSAVKGFDIASGWGTIYAPRFVPALVRATRAARDEQAARAQAAAALAALRDAVSITAIRGSARVIGTGFVPELPVTLIIGTRRIATLYANQVGDAEYVVNPARLHLAAGAHTVALRGMVITETGRLTIG